MKKTNSGVDVNNLLSPLKIIPFYLKFSDPVKDKLSLISAEFHWTSNCNYDCVHCSYGSRRQTTNYLKREIIENLIHDLIDMKCKAIYLSGGGEPTTIKKWNYYADKLMSSGIEVALITNGVAIQEKHIITIQNMNYIAISVYSTKEERYKRITGSNAFAQQFSLPSKLKNNVSRIIVGARCVINRINYDELYKIYCSAIEAGFDYIIFIPVVDYECRGVVLEEKWVELVKKNIEDNIDKFDHKRTNVKSLMNRSVSHYYRNNYLDDFSNNTAECSAINIGSGVFFNYDGGVYLCQPDIGNVDLEIGNLNDDRFINIWNSSRHKKVLKKLNRRWRDGKCANCRSIAFNKAIHDHQQKPVNIENINLDYFL